MVFMIVSFNIFSAIKSVYSFFCQDALFLEILPMNYVYYVILEEKRDERQNLLTGTFCFSLPNSVLCNGVWRSHLKRSLI